jgi:hypothetical protein
MNLLQNIVGAIHKQMHSFILLCSLTIAAAGKRNMGSGCWFYDSEMPNYVSVKIPKHSPVLALSVSLLQTLFSSASQLQQTVSDVFL